MRLSGMLAGELPPMGGFYCKSISNTDDDCNSLCTLDGSWSRFAGAFRLAWPHEQRNAWLSAIGFRTVGQDRLLMFDVRRRWPVLTAAAAALLYVVNNYQIAGLEHLRLAPLESPPQNAVANPNLNDPNGLGFDLTQFGIRLSPEDGSVASSGSFSIDTYSPSAQSSSPQWSDMLSVGEKMALWQDKLVGVEPSQQSLQSGPNAVIPSTAPIPFPQGGSSLTSPRDELGLPRTMTSIDTSTAGSSPNLSGFSASNPPNNSIRVASFKLAALGPALLQKPQAVQLIVSILRQYDVVALQGIQSSRDDILPLLVDKLNQSGRKFDYLIGPRVGRQEPQQQFAFVFDTQKLETDRYQLYTVDDPEDLMNAEPLVAWFRCKGVPQQDAFTFSLINVAIEPLFADAERGVLPTLIDAIESDGRQEDDWILAGDFAGGNAQLTMLDNAFVRFAVSDMPTNVVGTQMLDTIAFPARATTEFTGRAGAFDFLRKYNLTLESAMEVSEHMPVWAEFSPLEGSEPGRLAPVTSLN